jgi:hypothetical protein
VTPRTIAEMHTATTQATKSEILRFSEAMTQCSHRRQGPLC